MPRYEQRNGHGAVRNFTTRNITGIGVEPVLNGISAFAPERDHGPVKGNTGVYVASVVSRSRPRGGDLRCTRAKEQHDGQQRVPHANAVDRGVEEYFGC